MKNLLTTILATFCAVVAMGQIAPDFWKQVTYGEIFLPEKSETAAMPSEYLLLSLDYASMLDHLRNAPAEGSPSAKSGTFRVKLPLFNGAVEEFRVWESSVMHPDLAAKYPEIRTFAGEGVTDPTKSVRLGHGYDGFHAVILSGHHATAVTRYATEQNQFYIAFEPSKFNLVEGTTPPEHVCGHDHSAVIDPALTTEAPPVQFRGGGEGALTTKRRYRLALSSTSAYASLHGGTVQGVLSSFATAVSTLNGILNRDAGVELILIPQTEQLIFINAASDPFTTINNGGSLLGQNQTITNNTIGIGSYDVGQVFTGPCTDVGGVVSGTTCSGGKARGVTCNWSNNIVGSMLGVGAHEFGHQFSAGHTWANCPGNEGQFASGSAWEPGSGTTILSYKGACNVSNISGPDNVIYHSGTTGQIWNFTRTGGGSNCGFTVETSNHSPVITWPYSNGFYIPISTPFELEAAATDADGDPLLYVWEQMNLGPSLPLGQQAGTSPSFRVYNPSPSPKRVFPRLPVLLNNGSENTELLPTYTRNMAFRFMVRDNNVSEGAAGLTWEDVSFEATATAGPFLVTNPNTADVVWKAGQQVEVTWDVANTDNALVNCKAVNIKLSVDGGLTFPHTLASFTPNDGSETVFVPGVATANARVRVEAAENIFFDLSNQNFTVEPADVPGFTVVVSPQIQQVCVPESASVELTTGSILDFDEPVEFEITGGLPVGVGVSFSSNPVTPGESVTLTFDMDNVTADGFFEIELRAVAGTDTAYSTLFFNIVYNDFSAFALEAPEDGISGLGLLPVFSWTDLPQADLFDFQLATSPSFGPGTIIDQAFNLTDPFYTPTVALLESNIYFWRVRPSNECGRANFSTTRAFQTRTVTCESFPANDVPKPISGIGLPTVQSKMPILQNNIITDLNVSQLRGTHDAIPDIEVKLISPQGTEVTLFSQICGNVSQFDLALNDESPFEIQCPPINGISYKPQEPLAAFIGESTLGEWTMQVKVVDNAGNGGSLQAWSLQFCANTTPKGPFMVNNDTIYVKPLQTRVIHNYELAAEHEDVPGGQLKFILADNTAEGFLSKNGVQLASGETFTMTDIHQQNITYTNTDGDAVYDFFTFIVESGNGGWTGTHRLNIVIDEDAVTGTDEAGGSANDLFLFPNPAANLLNIRLRQPLAAEGGVFVTDLQGRLVLQQKVPAAQQQLQLGLDHLASGIYFLTLRSEEGVVAKKFLVQK